MVKTKAFIDSLKDRGVRVKDGTNHWKLYYGKTGFSTCPRHPSKEISNKMAKKIKKQLGLS